MALATFMSTGFVSVLAAVLDAVPATSTFFATAFVSTAGFATTGFGLSVLTTTAFSVRAATGFAAGTAPAALLFLAFGGSQPYRPQMVRLTKNTSSVFFISPPIEAQ